MDRNGFAPIVVLLVAAVILVVSVGIWYQVSHRALISSNPMPVITAPTITNTSSSSLGTSSSTPSSHTSVSTYRVTWQYGDVYFWVTETDWVQSWGNYLQSLSNKASEGDLVFSITMINTNQSHAIQVPLSLVQVINEFGGHASATTIEGPAVSAGGGYNVPSNDSIILKASFHESTEGQPFVFTTGGASSTFFSVTLSDSDVVQVQYEPTSEGPDVTPPTVALLALPDNSRCANTCGDQIGVTNDPGPTLIELYVDDILAGNTIAPPYDKNWYGVDGVPIPFVMLTWRFPALSSPEPHTIFVKAYDASGNEATTASVTQISMDSIVPGDTAAPSIPQSLSADEGIPVHLSWNASTDNTAVFGYRVYRNGVLVAMVDGTSFDDWHVVPKNTYTYTVTAYDGDGNTSARSVPAIVRTLSGPTIPFLGPGL